MGFYRMKLGPFLAEIWPKTSKGVAPLLENLRYVLLEICSQGCHEIPLTKFKDNLRIFQGSNSKNERAMYSTERRIQGFQGSFSKFKDPPKFSLKFKDFSRISRIDMKFKDFFKDVATLVLSEGSLVDILFSVWTVVNKCLQRISPEMSPDLFIPLMNQ